MERGTARVKRIAPKHDAGGGGGGGGLEPEPLDPGIIFEVF